MAQRPLTVPPVSPKERANLDQLYRRTRDARLRTRAQMILLALEQEMVASEIASIVRCCEQTVLGWIRRFNAEGPEGLCDRPRPREPMKGTPEYHDRLLHSVRRRPRALGQPYSLWSLQRLADWPKRPASASPTRACGWCWPKAVSP